MSSYSGQNVLKRHKQRCDQQEITSNKTSNESHIFWKKHFHTNPLGFRIYAGFEPDNEYDNSSIGIETTNVYKQSPVFNGSYRVYGMNDVLQSGYYETLLEYDIVDWLCEWADQKRKKMAFCHENIQKYFIMCQKGDEQTI